MIHYSATFIIAGLLITAQAVAAREPAQSIDLLRGAVPQGAQLPAGPEIGTPITAMVRARTGLSTLDEPINAQGRRGRGTAGRGGRSLRRRQDPPSKADRSRRGRQSPVPRTAAVPRRIYPYVYGALGLGYFYYDPYLSPWGTRGAYGYPRGYGGYDRHDDWRHDDLGKVRLDVRGPKDAQVLVNGYYAGVLDDFDGIFQGLNLESGTYRIEVTATGFEPLAFDTRVMQSRKVTLHGALHRAGQ